MIDATEMDKGKRHQAGMRRAASMFRRLGDLCDVSFAVGNYDIDLAISFRYRGEARGFRIINQNIDSGRVFLMVDDEVMPAVINVRAWMAGIDEKRRAEAIAASRRPETDFAPNEEPLA